MNSPDDTARLNAAPKDRHIGVKVVYTLMLVAGLTFLLGVAWLMYWLLFLYQVRNLAGIGAIVLFLGIPLLSSLFKIPAVLSLLVAIWRADDPASLERDIGYVRERGAL